MSILSYLIESTAAVRYRERNTLAAAVNIARPGDVLNLQRRRAMVPSFRVQC
jgi:hypothetical protein